MTTARDDTYIVRDDPADPEAAAMDLIVRVPGDVLGKDSTADRCVAGLHVAAARRRGLLCRHVLA
jgi:hypothetical protein